MSAAMKTTKLEELGSEIALDGLAAEVVKLQKAMAQEIEKRILFQKEVETLRFEVSRLRKEVAPPKKVEPVCTCANQEGRRAALEKGGFFLHEFDCPIGWAATKCQCGAVELVAETFDRVLDRVNHRRDHCDALEPDANGNWPK